MAVTLLQAFEATIKPNLTLNKKGSFFEIIENNKGATNTYLRIGGCKGFGFSLDTDKGSHAWGFIVNAPLPGIVSVCDGILVLNYKGKNYIIVLDLKSKNVSSKAIKQICSGAFLCDWLCNLFTLHKHINESYEIIGLICKSRNSARKQGTRKKLNAEVNNKGSYPILTVSNPNTLHIADILAELE